MEDAIKKEALRLFTYGLYAVTTGDADAWNAFTANWLSQVSFDPPLVALSVENASVSLPMIRRSGVFAVNVYSAEQRELAGRLGKSLGRSPEKLVGMAREIGESGCPLLVDAIAWVECRMESELPAGDSTLVVGRVVGAGVRRQAEPLTMRAAGFKHAG
ncbi:MAG TPA: flavin reductase family protein [Ktedonobacterales bacterium]|nr:flavin reductase family protein [Ktedonobacterales bacterium]